VTEKPEKAPTDWEAIEKEYRLGQLTVREIARRHGIAPSSITRKAEKLGWARDLTEEVRAKTRAALLRNTDNATPPRNTPSREDVNVAVQTNVELVRQHRGYLGRGNRIVEKLLAELDSGTDSNAEIVALIEEETAEDKNGQRRARMLAAVSLPTRAAVARELSQTLKNLIPLERQAFNIDDKGSPPDGTPDNPISVVPGMTTQQAAEAYARLRGRS